MTTLQDNIKAVLRSGTPLVTVETADTLACQDMLRDLILTIYRTNGGEPDVPLVGWDWARGLYALSEAGKHAIAQAVAAWLAVIGATPNGDEASVIKIDQLLIDLAAHLPPDAILMIQHLHFAFDENTANRHVLIQAIKNLRDPFKASGRLLIGLVRPGVSLPPEIRNDIMQLDDELPTEESLAALTRKQVDQARQNTGFEHLPIMDDMEIRTVVGKLLGMTNFAAEQQMALSLKPTGMDLEMLDDRVRKAISGIPGLTAWKGDETWESVGGLTNLKAFLEQIMAGKNRPRVVIFIDEVNDLMAGVSGDNTGIAQDFHQVLLTHMQDYESQGILIYGVSGTGKSHIAKALGNYGSMPVIKLDTGGMKHSHVGVSESNIRSAFKSIHAISGGHELFIATCNDTHALTPQFQSRFRLGLFFVDIPSKEEGESVWNIQKKLFPQIDWAQERPDWDGWVGREINKCSYIADNLGISLVDASQYVVPIAQSSRDEIQRLREHANGRYLSASYAGAYHTPTREKQHSDGASTSRRRRIL